MNETSIQGLLKASLICSHRGFNSMSPEVKHPYLLVLNSKHHFSEKINRIFYLLLKLYPTNQLP